MRLGPVLPDRAPRPSPLWLPLPAPLGYGPRVDRALFIEAMAVLAMMIALAALKRRTRKSGLVGFVKRHSQPARRLRVPLD